MEFYSWTSLKDFKINYFWIKHKFDQGRSTKLKKSDLAEKCFRRDVNFFRHNNKIFRRFEKWLKTWKTLQYNWAFICAMITTILKKLWQIKVEINDVKKIINYYEQQLLWTSRTKQNVIFLSEKIVTQILLART